MTNKYRLYCFGNTTIDHIFRISGYSPINSYGSLLGEARTFGGKGANVAYAASQAIDEVGCTLAIGRDFKDSGYYEHLEESNLVFEPEKQLELESNTTRFYSIYDGNHHMMFAESFQTQHRPKQLVEFCSDILSSVKSDCIYTCFGDQDANLHILKLTKEELNAVTAFNINDGIVNKGVAFVDELLRHCDILFLNEKEYAYLSNIYECEFSHIYADYNIGFMVVTLGSKGCRIFTKDKSVVIPVEKLVEVIDPVGAGDCFAGVYLAYYLRTSNCELAAHMGNRAAGICVQKMGAQVSLQGVFD